MDIPQTAQRSAETLQCPAGDQVRVVRECLGLGTRHGISVLDATDAGERVAALVARDECGSHPPQSGVHQGLRFLFHLRTRRWISANCRSRA